MATATVTDYVTRTITHTVSAVSATSTLKSPPQGGILEGGNPTVYDAKNPIILFIIQAGIVVTFCRILHWPLSKLRQPRVIAEVIVGILLGPSVFGRIPGFTNAIFPAASIPNLTLVANLGLVLFLFLVGLEVDLRYLASNWRIAVSVGLVGMALAAGLGCAISYGLYHSFREDAGIEPISFGTYMLFIAIAMAITAFPVLCRILTELKLLDTPVGVIVLSAGVGNDVVGWILLALCVSLVNAANGLNALYVLLVALGYTLFLVFAVRPAFMWVLRRTQSLEEGPTQPVVALTLLICLVSAFFTGVIGVHPIFGAFLAGLICPHEGGFAIKVTEKIEDLVSTLFLPLYFALSGLSTNLGLLNDAITWAYVIGVTAVAFFGKFAGGAAAARVNGMVWRESFTIGALMSCKGLVELIVLNIGLNANILSRRTFTIFVVMALVTTFTTSPLTAALYPPWYQKKLEAWKRGEIDWDTGKPAGSSDHDPSDIVAIEKAEALQIRKVLVYLRLDSMPGLLTLAALLGGANERTADEHEHTSTASTTTPTNSRPASLHPKLNHNASRLVSMHGVRLLQLSDRESSVAISVSLDSLSIFDPVVNTFRAFGRLHSVLVSGEVAIVPENYYADTLVSRAAETNANLLLVPWTETNSMSEFQTLSTDGVRSKLGPSAMTGTYATFMQDVLTSASSVAVGIFINNGFGGDGATTYRPRNLSRTVTGISVLDTHNQDQDETSGVALTRQRRHKVFVPYFGTLDDRVAVRFVLQLARDTRVTVAIAHYKLSTQIEEEMDLSLSPAVSRQNNGNGSGSGSGSGSAAKGTVKSTAIESIPLHERHAAFLAVMRSSLPADVAARVSVDSVNVDGADGNVTIEDDVVARAKQELGQRAQDGGDLIVLGRNGSGRTTAQDSCLGKVGSRLLGESVEASLLVVQAASQGRGR